MLRRGRGGKKTACHSVHEGLARVEVKMGTRNWRDAGSETRPDRRAPSGFAKGALLSLVLFAANVASGVERWPAPTEANFTIKNFRCESGETLPALTLHYRTLGEARRDAAGVVRNAVLILHGTTGSGRQFLTEQFAGVLFGAGELLDASRYFIILPDDIGTGQSTKPSDGLHARFPHYDYHDMVVAEHALVTEGLNLNHLRLVMGTSMGGMHTWMWGEMYPDFMDALLPLACLPVQIAGRNRMTRVLIMDSIRKDPEWNHGEYKTEPRGLLGAAHLVLMMTSSPLQWQKRAPTQRAADELLSRMVQSLMSRADANNWLYQFDASHDYNPEPELEKIVAPLVAINSADDQVNPPELGIAEREIKRVKRGRFVLLPITDETRGHGTHSLPAIWNRHLAELLAESER
jgi:homoserine O-acetyltransferase/O-succinyltransferase